MLFLRTDEQFWRMTPKQIAALCQIHEEMNDPEGVKKKKEAKGTAQDLMMFQNMRRAS